MKIAAFTYVNFFDNEMKQKIVEVENDATWKDVFVKCFDVIVDKKEPENDHDDDGFLKWVLESLSDDLNEARVEMVDGEIDIIVTFYEPKANFLEK